MLWPSASWRQSWDWVPSLPLEPGFSGKEKTQGSGPGQEGRKEKWGGKEGWGKAKAGRQTGTV